MNETTHISGSNATVTGTNIQDFVDQLQKKFSGWHVKINIYPNGGRITAEGCGDCGTADSISYSFMWRYGLKESINTAIDKLKKQLDKDAWKKFYDLDDIPKVVNDTQLND